MAVAERVVLGQLVMARGLIDRGRAHVQEGADAGVFLHEEQRAAHVAVERDVPLVGLDNGEMQDVVDLVREITEIALGEVRTSRFDARRVQRVAGAVVAEARDADDLVLLGERFRDGSRDVAGDAGHEVARHVPS